MYDKKKTIVIKIGSDALCHDDGTVDAATLGSIAEDVSQLKKEGHHVIMVLSGAIKVGRRALPDDSFPACSEEVTRKQISGGRWTAPFNAGGSGIVRCG